LKSELTIIAALEAVSEHDQFPGSGKACRIVLGLPERKIERTIQVFKLTLSLHHKTGPGFFRHFVRS